jgi:hypothetical protein
MSLAGSYQWNLIGEFIGTTKYRTIPENRYVD